MYPSDAQILKYILMKKGIITAEEWEKNAEELTIIITENNREEAKKVEQFLNDFLKGK